MGKIIITGPGRSGTTFLIQLLTRLGYNTGFEPFNEPYDHNLRAGGEYYVEDIDFSKENAQQVRERLQSMPHIVKGPEWSFLLKPLLSNRLIEIDHIIMPIRDIDEAAQSRMNVGLIWRMMTEACHEECQADVMAQAVGRVIEACLLFDVPYTIMRYPRLTNDKMYCLGRLAEVFMISDAHLFNKIFEGLKTR